VIESALVNAKAKGLSVGVVGKAMSGTSPASVACAVKEYEFAPDPYDVAIGITEYRTPTYLTLKEISVHEWTEVATLGYPLDAVSGAVAELNLNHRCLRGYIQRPLRPGDLHIGKHPDAFETSFLVGRGISGSPLFVHREPKDIVIGVCVGSSRSEIVEDEFTEIQNNGARYTEKKLKIEQFGVAHDIRHLLKWQPALLKGKTLGESSGEG
jgi:hypothetical protein